jgi:hypothetical protein
MYAMYIEKAFSKRKTVICKKHFCEKIGHCQYKCFISNDIFKYNINAIKIQNMLKLQLLRPFYVPVLFKKLNKSAV